MYSDDCYASSSPRLSLEDRGSLAADAVYLGRRRKRADAMVLTCLFVVTLLLPATGLSKSKGLPSSVERKQYCDQKLAECLADVGPTCSDTYEKAEHVVACMNAGRDECSRSFGKSSRCLTSPRILPGASEPLDPGTGSIQGDRPSKPDIAAPRPAGPVRLAPTDEKGNKGDESR